MTTTSRPMSDEPESAPFDPNTLPPHLRAKLDRISAIRWRMLESIASYEEQDAARAAQQNDEAAASPSTEIAAAS